MMYPAWLTAIPDTNGEPIVGAVAWVTVNSPQPGVAEATDMFPLGLTLLT